MSIARPSRALILVGLTALAGTLRLWNLGRDSLWLDEAATWWNATLPTLRDCALAEVNHGPVWWLWTRGFVHLFGDGEAALRAPAALLGTAAVPLTFLLAERLAPPTADRPGVALLAGVLAACGGFWIEYAQEARMYAGLLCAAIALSLLLLDWLETGRDRLLLAYAALAALALYMHLFAVWPLLAHAAWLLLRLATGRDRAAAIRLLKLGSAQVAAVIAFAPWLLRSLAHPAGVAASGRFNPLTRLASSLWRMGVGPALEPYDAVRIAAGVGPFLETAGTLVIVTFLVWGGAILLGAIELVRTRRGGWFVATGVLVPVIGLLLVHSRLPLMHEKYLIFIAPLLVVLAATGARSAPGLLRPALTISLLVLALASGLASPLREMPFVARVLQGGHPSGKESWREVQRDIAADAAAGEIVVLYPAYLDRAWRYYDRGAHPTLGLARLPVDAQDLRELIPGIEAAARVTYVLAHEDTTARRALLDVFADESAIRPEDIRKRVRLYPRQFGIRVVRVERDAAGSGARRPD